MLNKKVPVYALPISLLVGIACTYFGVTYFSKSTAPAPVQPAATTENNCLFKIERVKGNKLTHPLVSVQDDCESKKYAPIKTELEQTLQHFKSNGQITNAGVFIKDLTTGEWIGVNQDDKFDPGTLVKMPLLVTFLKMEENKPGILKREVIFEQPAPVTRPSLIVRQSLTPGNKYTVQQLLESMIVHSDNASALQLAKYVDQSAFNQTFSDLGLSEACPSNSPCHISAREYSIFFEALYSDAYVTIQHSEYAASLLSNTMFTDGLVKGIPAEVKIAHKFGEGGTGAVHEIHECGIVYLNNAPYLISVMTTGPTAEKLPEVLANISAITFRAMKKFNES